MHRVDRRRSTGQVSVGTEGVDHVRETRHDMNLTLLFIEGTFLNTGIGYYGQEAMDEKFRFKSTSIGLSAPPPPINTLCLQCGDLLNLLLIHRLEGLFIIWDVLRP